MLYFINFTNLICHFQMSVRIFYLTNCLFSQIVLASIRISLIARFWTSIFHFQSLFIITTISQHVAFSICISHLIGFLSLFQCFVFELGTSSKWLFVSWMLKLAWRSVFNLEMRVMKIKLRHYPLTDLCQSTRTTVRVLNYLMLWIPKIILFSLIDFEIFDSLLLFIVKWSNLHNQVFHLALQLTHLMMQYFFQVPSIHFSPF